MKARDAVESVSAYPVQPGTRRDKIRLDLNENTRGCAPGVLEALRSVGSLDVSGYPDYQELIDRIASRYTIPSSNVLLTNGADDAIRAVMQTYVDPGDDVVLAEPSFAMTQVYAQVTGARVRTVSYDREFRFPAAQFLAAIEPRTRLVAIVRPDSPTGAVIARSDLIEILNKLRNGVVLLDETYHHFLRETCARLVEQFRNLVVVQSFSKAYGLAGLRLGFVASDPRNVQQIQKVNPPFAVNSLAVIAGLKALEDEPFLEQILKDVKSERDFLARELSGLGLEVRESPANFLLVHVGREPAAVHQELARRNILVKDMSSSPLLQGFLRVAVGTRSEHLALVQALQEALPPEIVLFDMDGVLVDVSGSYRLAIQKTAEHFSDDEITPEEIERYKRAGGYNNDWDLTEALIRARGRTVSRKSIVRFFQDCYLGKDFNGAISNERWLLSPSSLQSLSRKYRLGIVTGRPRPEALHVLKRFDVDRYFDVVITSEDVQGKQKPDPLGLRLALEKLAGRRAVYLGDTVDDVQAALRAGVVPIGVLPPHASGDRQLGRLLEETGARQVLGHVNELVEVLR